MQKKRKSAIAEGEASYRRWVKDLRAHPDFERVYAEEAAKKELWLQLAEARLAAGLTQAQLAKRLKVSQAQVARIEKRGYDAHSLRTLRRYVAALGKNFELNVAIRHDAPAHPVVHS